MFEHVCVEPAQARQYIGKVNERILLQRPAELRVPACIPRKFMMHFLGGKGHHLLFELFENNDAAENEKKKRWAL